MLRLQVELVLGFGRDELHGRTLHGLGNRLGVAVIVLVALEKSLHISGRHQPCVMAHSNELAREMVRAAAGLHANEARRRIRELRVELATAELGSQLNAAVLVQANEVEDVLADVDADHGNRGCGSLGSPGHGRAPW